MTLNKYIIILIILIFGMNETKAGGNKITMVFDATDSVISKGLPNAFIYYENSDNEICSSISSKGFTPVSLNPKEYALLLDKCGNDRYISKKGNEIHVRVFYENISVPKINFSEKKRKSRISSDLRIIYDTLNPLSKAAAFATTPNIVEAIYILSLERAILNVEVTYSKADSKGEYKVDLVTGPEEHWFLSLDLPVSNSDTLKYDQSTSQLVEKDTPSDFLIGINYMLGDVLTDNLPWKKKFAAKLMVKASNRPFDSIGIGIGYRFNEFKLGSKKLGATSIFVGSFWDKEDTVNGDIVNEDDKYKQNWKIGISFNLDKLSGWLK